MSDGLPRPDDGVPSELRELDEYRLLRLLGAGATGRVFLARDTALDRDVAIKLLRTTQVDGPARDRFFAEARLVARLAHPNLVTVHRIGEFRRQPYLVCELVKGEPLDQVERPLPSGRLLGVALGLARALGAAHRQGVLHRDVKPANVVLDERGEARLLDFGIAQLISQSEADGAGTPLYLAPELWSGELPTPRSDVYALGALLYELATGSAPHAGERVEGLARAALEVDAAPLAETAPGLPPELAAVIHACLVRDPAARLESGDAVCDALERMGAAEHGGPPPGNPYRGLTAFATEDHALFFGREGEVRALLDRLRTEPFLLIAGDSGAGKSSLCRAGLVPAVTRGALGEAKRWSAVTVVPGRWPLAALAAALAPLLGASAPDLEARLAIGPEGVARDLSERATGTLILVDQLEELLTVSELAPAAARAFAAFTAHLPRVRLVATLRADFLARAAGLPELGGAVAGALFLLGPLGERGLRAAITGPARAVGYHFVPAQLVDELVARGVGRLPLLSFALAELWEVRDDGTHELTGAALDRLGGVEGALARHADAVLAALRPEERATAWRILTRLGGAAGTRLALAPDELTEIAGAPAAAVVERLIGARLLVASESERGGTQVEVVHEALFTDWPRLAAWRAVDAEGVRQQGELSDSARTWDGRGRVGQLLLGGADLDAVLRWRRRAPEVVLTAIEAAFLAASVASAQGRRRRRLAAVSAAFASLSAVVLFLLHANHQATAERRRAESASIALLEEQGRRELVGGHATRALAYLASALQRGGEGPALRFLIAEATRPFLAEIAALEGDASPLIWAAWSPDGSHVATSLQDDGCVRVFGRAGGKPLLVLRARGARSTHLAWSLDGRRLAAADWDERARIWSVPEGHLLAELDVGVGHVEYVAFVDDALVALGTAGAVLWDLGAGAPRAVLDGPERRPVSLAVAPAGGALALGHFDGVVGLWASDGRALGSVRGHEGAVWSLRFSPDGQRLASVGDDGTAKLWDLRAQPVAALLGHTGPVFAAGFSADGARLVTASDDGTAKLWDATSGRLQATLLGHAGPVNDATFGPTGEVVATASDDGTVKLWAPTGGRARATFEAGRAMLVAFGPDGSVVLTAAREGAELWSVGRDPLLVEIRQPARVQGVAFAPDGHRFASAGSDGVVVVRDTAGGGEQVRSDPGAGALAALAYSPDGSRLAAAGADGTVRLLEPGSGATVRVLAAHTGTAYAVAFSRDGTRLASAGADGLIRLFTADGAPVRAFEPGSGRMRALAFAPDGRLAAVGRGRLIRVYAPDGDQPVLEIDHGPAELHGVAFSPDGRRLATAGFEGVSLYDAGTGARLVTLEAHGGISTAVAFSPDGGRLATASPDHSVRIWDGVTGAALGVREGHLGYVLAVAWSPDGERLASGAEGAVIVWDAHLDLREPAEVARFVAAHPSVARLMP